VATKIRENSKERVKKKILCHKYFKDHKNRKDPKDSKNPKDHKNRKDPEDSKAPKDHKNSKDPKDLKDPKDHKKRKDPKDSKDPKDHKKRKESGLARRTLVATRTPPKLRSKSSLPATSATSGNFCSCTGAGHSSATLAPALAFILSK